MANIIVYGKASLKLLENFKEVVQWLIKAEKLSSSGCYEKILTLFMKVLLKNLEYQLTDVSKWDIVKPQDCAFYERI